MTLPVASALGYTLLAGLLVVFQLGLALGAPWGEYAMGGAFRGRYPPRMRAGAVVQALLTAAMAVVVLSHAGVLLLDLSEAYPWLIWATVAFAAVGVVLNAITRSARERRLWLPVAIGLLVTSLVVALAR